MATPDQWPRVRTLLEKVLEATEAERDALLQACTDAEIRGEVQALLEHADEQ